MSIPPKKLKSIKVGIQRKRKVGLQRSVGLPALNINSRHDTKLVGIPTLLSGSIAASLKEHDDNGGDADEFPLDEFLPLNDLPCDTLILMRSIEQTQQCLYVPLERGGLVPTILESQLYSKLEGGKGEDSVVTSELHTLASNNQIRRLVPLDEEHVIAWVETKHYLRAVWDAHRKYVEKLTADDAVAVKVTTWFLSHLSTWTKRNISKDAMKHAWTDSAALKLDRAIDLLVSMEVLMPTKKSTFLLWLPQWGAVLAAITKSQAKLIAHIKRSLYKELSVRTIKSQHYPGGLSGAFVLHTLETQGKVEFINRPVGPFARIPK